MCHFISLIVDGGDPSAIDAAARRLGRVAREADAAPIAHVLSAGERAFWTNRVGCDCGTRLGRDVEDDATQDDALVRARLHRKGWSEARIQRSLAESARVKAMPTRKRSSDSFELWRDLLSDLLAIPDVKTAGLLVHAYTGALEEGVVPARRREWLDNTAMLDGLRSLREDELLMFSRS